MKKFTFGLSLVAALNLSGCATILASMVPEQRVRLEDYVSCSKHSSAVSAVTEEICEQVNDLVHKEADLPDAVVGFDVQGKGRLQLAGKFKNEGEVEKAFAIAQAVVGSEWVSPVKPGHIQVEAWQACLTEKFAGRACSDAESEGYEIQKKPPGPVRDKYALVVGVGQFKNQIPHLSYAVKDAQAVANYLTNPKYGSFPASHVTVLTDGHATRQAILSALADLEQRAKPDDLVVIYFSSHGAPPNIFDHVNIVTYDTDLLFTEQRQGDLSWRDKILQKQALWDTSLSQQRLHEFHRKVQSKRVLLVLDVCYSGDVFAQIPGFKPTGSEALARSEASYSTGYSAEQLAHAFGSKDLMVEDDKAEKKNATGHAHSHDKSNARPVQMAAKSTRGWGKVIVSASSGKERSWEPDPTTDAVTPNSYFTYFFLTNLQRKDGRIQDSFLSAIPSVEEVAQRKGKTQQPQAFSVPNLNEWNFSINANH